MSRATDNREAPSTAPSRAKLGITCLLLTLACWSTVPLFLRDLSSEVDHWSNNGWRYGVSALIWLPALVLAWRRGRLPTRIWRDALIPSLFNIAGQAAFTAAFHEMNPGLVTFGLRTQLIWVAIGAYMFVPTERSIISSPRYLIGAAILLGGLFPVLLGGDASLGGFNPRGTALSIFCAFSYGMYGLGVRRCMAAYNPITAFAAICQITAIGLIALMLILGDAGGSGVPDLPSSVLLKLFVSAVIGIALGHILYYISIARIGIVITSGVLQLQPFFVGLASTLIFGERFAWWQWVSGSIAVVGAFLMLTCTGPGARQVSLASSEGSD
jgi:drug/metabolite transporter (DMT)-like permease